MPGPSGPYTPPPPPRPIEPPRPGKQAVITFRVGRPPQPADCNIVWRAGRSAPPWPYFRRDKPRLAWRVLSTSLLAGGPITLAMAVLALAT